ncbi:hypothetical protein ILUMI_06866 [Ignelater luminosus]|uniref:Zinc carboxypeptidase A 1 n=1 Tax=Ignelater luminosus TaxID=2038154 RepID=A0A8K0GC56_IGNLU|nr:hypothetical protein ILUMI_06866 [Ignelater luminosus]
MKPFLLLPLLVMIPLIATSKIRFDNYQVYQIIPNTLEQVNILRELEENSQGYDFWTDASKPGQPVDIMVPPHLKYNFLDFLNLQKLNAGVWIENVQKLIDDEKSQVSRRAEDFNWKEYHTLETINAWLDSLVERYPGIVTPIVGGRSYEGREIRGVKVSFGPGRKGAFIESGIHAREWIAPATVTYILNEFLNSKDASVRAVAESRDWYFFPSINPDGYAYTQIDRMWRKNRRPYKQCVGVDLNRNWDYHWMEGGASSDECSTTFAGGSAFSEIETKSLSEYITSVADTLDTYLAFHSYSQYLLIPFSHDESAVPENNDELHQIGKAAAESLSVRYGTNYTVGNWINVLYISSGVSVDWVVGTHQRRLGYTYELRDEGQHGFLLPPEQIIPTGEETLDSLVRMISEADYHRN